MGIMTEGHQECRLTVNLEDDDDDQVHIQHVKEGTAHTIMIILELFQYTQQFGEAREGDQLCVGLFVYQGA